MKKLLKILALAAFFSLVLAGFGSTAYAEHEPYERIFLLYQNGNQKAAYWCNVRSQMEGNKVLLKNSWLDDRAYCDMTDVQAAVDYAILHGAVKLQLKLSQEEYWTVKRMWQDGYGGEYVRLLFPALSWVRIAENSDGTYAISFGFPRYGNADNEEIAKKIAEANAIARGIVRGMPDRCTNDYNKVEYLYSYITGTVKYFDDTDDFHDYYRSGKDVCLVYDSLMRKETVCAGFAYSFAYLCELAGLDAHYVVVAPNIPTGNSHAVVIAKVNNSYYWFDPTYDEGNNQSGFKWFGLSDQEFKKNHDCPKTVYSRDCYPDCRGDLHHPFGYWDFDTMTYRRFAIFDEGINPGRYIISSALDNNRVLEIGGLSKTNGGNAQIWQNGFIDFQQFNVSKDGDYYTLKNRGSSLMLDVEGGRKVSGTNVQQYERNNSDAQKWRISRSGDNGFYYITTPGGLYLEVAGDSASDGANVRVALYTGKANQKWRLTRLENTAFREGRYVFTSALDDNRALQVSDRLREGRYEAQIYWNWFGDRQMFDVYQEGGGYMISNCDSGDYLHTNPVEYARTFSVCSHGYVAVFNNRINSNKKQQLWDFKYAGNGYYYIKSLLGDYYLEVDGTRAADYTSVHVGPYTGKDNQKWRLNMIRLFQ